MSIIKHRTLKRFIKRGIQHIAAAFGRHTRSSNQPQLLVLMYHRVLPADDQRALIEEPGMMVTPETFRLHLDILKQYFTMIKLSDWVQLKLDGKPLPDKACAITFDDGWADNYEFAFPVLNELQIPATIFLVSDMINTSLAFWPERVARLLIAVSENPQHWNHSELQWLQKYPDLYQFSATPPNQEEISEIIGSLKMFTDNEIHERLDKLEQILKLDYSADNPSLLDWSQVTEMTNSGLIEMGSHTRFHTRLNNKIPESQVKDEVTLSKQTIEQHIGESVKAFCYPNGDVSELAYKLVKENYAVAVTTQSGWNSGDTEPHLLNRIGVHQDISDDKTSFLARISGWV